MEEIWKDIPNYEGLYQVSNLGKVKSFYKKKESILKDVNDGKGYRYVQLFKFGKSKLFRIHQLVAMAFLNHTPCRFKLVVNHIDFNKSNNIVTNLEIVSMRYNSNLIHIPHTSKYTGVSWSKLANKWKVGIRINGKAKHLGYFTNELDASNAYQNQLRELARENKLIINNK